MRLSLKLSSNIYNLMRKLGYQPAEKGEKTGEPAFIRRLNPSDYPRFHIHIKNVSRENIEISLHLDQKKPIYRGATAHSGEYRGELVEKEAERIRKQSAER